MNLKERMKELTKLQKLAGKVFLQGTSSLMHCGIILDHRLDLAESPEEAMGQEACGYHIVEVFGPFHVGSCEYPNGFYQYDAG